jgi:hypothetical protein
VNFGAFFVEARYHYVWGPKIEAQSGGQSFSSNASYIPLTAGFRF